MVAVFPPSFRAGVSFCEPRTRNDEENTFTPPSEGEF